MTLDQLRADILADTLPQVQLTAADRAALERHQAFLAGLADPLVAAFYDALYAHDPTAAVFGDSERAMREQTLRTWWLRTVEGPLDDRYWSWMALVGIIHIRRGVRNPMMISGAAVLADEVHRRALAALPAAEAEALRGACGRLFATTTAIVSDAYTKSYLGAFENLAGLDPRLTGRMLDIEVRTLEEQGRQELG